LSAAQIPSPPTKEKTMADYSGGMNVAVTQPKEDTIESLLMSISKQISDLSGKANFIADKIGGSRPEVASPLGGEVPAGNTISHLHEIQRMVNRLENHLVRAENYLG
jgi:hypothetical protein